MQFRSNHVYGYHWSFIFCLITFLGYMAIWNWSYLPLTEGWFIVSAKEINEGRLPYRDFYAYLPPVYYWLNAGIYFIFANSIDAYRFFGLVVNASIMIATYSIFFHWHNSKGFSALASLLVMFLLVSGNAFVSYDFLYCMRAFALLGFLMLFIGGSTGIVAGAGLLTLAALTKQSDGSVMYFCGLITLIVFPGNRIEKLLLFSLTTLISCFLIFLPFMFDSDFRSIYDALIFQASNNKGGGASPLYNWLKHGFYSINNLYIFIRHILLIFSILWIFSWLVEKYLPKNMNSHLKLLSELSVTFIFLASFYLIADIQNFYEPRTYYDHFHSLVYLAAGYLVPLFFLLNIKPAVFNFDRTSLNEAVILNFAFIIGSGTSGGLTLVSISFCIGTLLLFFDRLVRCSVVFRAPALLYFSAVIFCLFQDKIEKPYHWWNINTPSIEKVLTSVWDTNHGKSLKEIKGVLAKCKYKPNNLLAFPHMTMFNIATNLPAHGKAITYWLDYLSDEHAASMFEALRYNAPDVLVYWNMPNVIFETHSNLFKNGKRLVQEDISDLLNSRKFLQTYDNIIVIKDGQNLYRLFTKQNLNCFKSKDIFMK